MDVHAREGSARGGVRRINSGVTSLGCVHDIAHNDDASTISIGDGKVVEQRGCAGRDVHVVFNDVIGSDRGIIAIDRVVYVGAS